MPAPDSTISNHDLWQHAGDLDVQLGPVIHGRCLRCIAGHLGAGAGSQSGGEQGESNNAGHLFGSHPFGFRWDRCQHPGRRMRADFEIGAAISTMARLF
ncbi:hypothetical protein AIOL_000304 [Candidatus Rhodobacter oscarellae]|uniref:Uncharacterized protein n=1 Tax=Candidatus Rhodobacter oscarellae TaxID=1675527 RepID=A0A0J9EC06_9RHOB|nr:hypothetical protein AIOL_000304 [Candidatus Rhodobacter lobularis]